MTLLFLSLFALCSTLTTIYCDYAGRRIGVYLAKPLTLLALLVLAFQSGLHGVYGVLIVTGLVLSLWGDVFLMLDRQRYYRAGLFSFLLAHIAYIAAFGYAQRYQVRLELCLPLLAFALLYFRLLLPGLGRERGPVTAYLIVISLMGMQALEAALRQESVTAWIAALGALLFMASDACHAWNRFRKPFPAAQALILGSYFLAQWLIVLSLGLV